MKKIHLLAILVMSMCWWCFGGKVVAQESEVVKVKEYSVEEIVKTDGDKYNSEELKLVQPVWMVGLKIQIGSDQVKNLSAQLRSKSNDIWSDWTELDVQLNELQNGYLYLDPVALDDKSDVVEFALQGDVQLVQKVVVVGLDPYDYSGKAKITGKYQKADSLNIINREEWGADESLMFWDDDMEHAKVKQIIVHHTAGNENSPLDPAAVVRGIYYYHTVTKGWGDIGYNYIIDQYGNVYEGRKGGLGTTAAHAYGYNTGSVGVSVIGNYEEAVPSDYAQAGLENVLAYVSFQTGVDLLGKVSVNGGTKDVVVGHRDVDQTACPGKNFYALLSQIKIDADKLAEKGGVKQFEARKVDLSANYISLDNGEVQDIEVKYLNTGTGAWLNGNGDVKLVTTSPKQRASKFATGNWENNSTVGEAERYSIMPNDYATFKLDLKGDGGKGVFTESFALMSQGKILDNTTFTVVIDNSGEEYRQKVSNFHGISAKYYRYEVVENPVINIVEGEKVKVELKLKNTGDNNWDKSGLFPIHLATSSDRDHNSIFYNASNWLTNNRLELQQKQVLPGEVGLFSFEFDGNLAKGSYQENYGLVLENISWIDGEELKLMINVEDARYAAELVGKSSQIPYLIPGEVASMWVDIRNTGNQTWYKLGNNAWQIGTSQAHDRSSSFYNANYWQSSTRTSEMQVDSVNPGEVVRMEILMQAPTKTGSYRECFAPVITGKQWLDGAEVCWDMVVTSK